MNCCFFMFLAPFGLPRPLFYCVFLFDSSINYYSDDFSIDYLRFVLVPLGLPRHRLSTELL